MKRILIGISGGIDSAASTLLLQEQGYEVVALWIDMLGNSQQRLRVEELCRRLRVPLIVEDVSELFAREVVRFTLDEHSAARTPSPCARCNTRIKWATLAAVADRKGIFHIATGHYVRIVKRGAQHYVARGIDPIKDQSYYLYGLDEDILSRAVTPLGEMRKTDVRQFLAQRDFEELSSGGESQGLCFVESGYGDFLRTNLAPTAGDVVNCRGEVVGRHSGYQLYTIGQKRGFDTSAVGEIRHIDATHNRIEVGAPMMSGVVECCDAVFRPFDESLPLSVAVRGLGRNPQGYAQVERNGDRLTVTLIDERAWAVASGQPVVIYCGDVVVGGAIAR